MARDRTPRPLEELLAAGQPSPGAEGDDDVRGPDPDRDDDDAIRLEDGR